MGNQEPRSSALLLPPSSNRVSFRPLNLADAHKWEEFVTSEQAMKFFTYPRHPAESIKWIERQLYRYSDRGDGLMAVLDAKTDKLLGQCGLLWQEFEDRELLEVGYSFLPEFWGRGLATEAAGICYKYGLESGLSDYLYSVIHTENLASTRVAEKNGLKLWKTAIWKKMPVQVWRTGKRVA
ncbi:MAG: GNAT family N-acetyltransferase [Vicingaceae bacterium]